MFGSHLGRLLWAKFLVPDYCSYEQLWLWPRDEEGNNVVPETFNIHDYYLENFMYVFCWGWLALSCGILISVLTGLRNNELYVDRLKKGDSKELKKTKSRSNMDVLRIIFNS